MRDSRILNHDAWITMSDSRCMTHDAWLTRPDSRCAKISHDSRTISVFQRPPTRILFPKSHSTVLSILHDLNRCRVTAPTAHYQLTRMINQNHINRKCICCQYTPLHSIPSPKYFHPFRIRLAIQKWKQTSNAPATLCPTLQCHFEMRTSTWFLSNITNVVFFAATLFQTPYWRR